MRQLRTKVLQGKEFAWSDFLGRQGPQYPNKLSKKQLLALAAQLPPTQRPETQTGDAASSEGYVTVQEE